MRIITETCTPSRTYVCMYVHTYIFSCCIHSHMYAHVRSHAHMHVRMYVNSYQGLWVAQTCCGSEDGVGVLPLGVTHLRKGGEELQ